MAYFLFCLDLYQKNDAVKMPQKWTVWGLMLSLSKIRWHWYCTVSPFICVWAQQLISDIEMYSKDLSWVDQWVSELYVSLQFSDVLIYGSRMQPPKLQFKVHGQMALCNTDVNRFSCLYDSVIFWESDTCHFLLLLFVNVVFSGKWVILVVHTSDSIALWVVILYCCCSLQEYRFI